MTDIELVIKIPEEEYKRLVYIDMFKLKGYIENGTPLPKGHGRLIDADDIDNHIIGHVDTRSCPTIIAADKGADNG